MRDKSTRAHPANGHENLPVEVATITSLHVAAVRAYGVHPEADAWRMLLAWARTRGFGHDLSRHRFFGFNQPDPVPGCAEYGYEQWMSVPAGTTAEPPIVLKEFPGGRFLATRCRGAENIAGVWRRLFRWCQHSAFAPEFERPFLEECLTPRARRPEDFEFRLLLPVSPVSQASPAPRAA